MKFLPHMKMISKVTAAVSLLLLVAVPIAAIVSTDTVSNTTF